MQQGQLTTKLGCGSLIVDQTSAILFILVVHPDDQRPAYDKALLDRGMYKSNMHGRHCSC